MERDGLFYIYYSRWRYGHLRPEISLTEQPRIVALSSVKKGTRRHISFLVLSIGNFKSVKNYFE
jgi:hypothetical protein